MNWGIRSFTPRWELGSSLEHSNLSQDTTALGLDIPAKLLALVDEVIE